MHDNASPYTAPESIKKQAVRELDPVPRHACSPDMNLINTIQFIIKQRIEAYKNPPTKIQELHGALAAEWARITQEEILAVVDTMLA